MMMTLFWWQFLRVDKVILVLLISFKSSTDFSTSIINIDVALEIAKFIFSSIFQNWLNSSENELFLIFHVASSKTCFRWNSWFLSFFIKNFKKIPLKILIELFVKWKFFVQHMCFKRDSTISHRKKF